MKDIIEKIKNNGLWMDFFNLFTGIILVVVIVLFCLYPGNKIILAMMFLLTGMMNLSNGIKKCRDKKTQSMGMVLMMISVITLIAGIMIFFRIG